MDQNLSTAKRQGGRIYVALPVAIRAGSEGKVVMQGDTVDLSDVGLRVRTELPVLINQKVEVVLNNNDPRPKKYEVIWVRDPAKKRPTYEVGLKMAV